MKINLLDLFSGIGGFSQGLKQAGFEINKHYTSEIDKHAKAIYKKQFPGSIDVGDVRHVRADKLERIDAITFGFPCQDLSLAGKRKGFDGERSSLFHEGIRLIRDTRPKFFIWENVAGLISSRNGDDIDIVFDEMVKSGYMFDYQDLNTSWYLPQNRVRVYCVGFSIEEVYKCLKEANGKKKKLNFSKQMCQGYLLAKLASGLIDPKKGLEIKQKENLLNLLGDQRLKKLSGQNLKSKYSKIILELKSIISIRSYQDILKKLLKLKDTNLAMYIRENQKSLLMATKSDIKEKTAKRKLFTFIGKLLKNISEENLKKLSTFIISILIKQITKSKTFTYVEMQALTELYIAHLIQYYPNCLKEASLDLIKKQRDTNYAKNRSNKTRSKIKVYDDQLQLPFGEESRNELVGTLGNESGPEIFPIKESNIRTIKRSKQAAIARCLTAGGNSGGLHSSMTLVAENLQGKSYCNTIRSGGRGSLTKKHNWDLVKVGAIHGRNPKNPKSREPGLATTQQFEENRKGVANTLTSVQKDTVIMSGGSQKNSAQMIDKSPCLNSAMGLGGGHIPIVDRIRRLTEIECERLQGFKDNHTQYGNYDDEVKKVPATQRYKCLGNAVTVDVVQAVGERIIESIYT